MPTITQLLGMSPAVFKKEARQTWNRIRRLELKQAKLKEQKADLDDTSKEELRSLKDYTCVLSQAVKQWF